MAAVGAGGLWRRRGDLFRPAVGAALWPLLLGAIVSGAGWMAARRRGWARRLTWPLMMLACLSGGLAAAKIRTEMVAAPIAPALGEATVIEAWVVDVDSPGQRGARIVVAPVWIRGWR